MDPFTSALLRASELKQQGVQGLYASSVGPQI